jgi:hypothetical protein
MLARLCLVLLGLLLAVGCGASTHQLRTRAAIDLSCSGEKLRLHRVDRHTFQVTGCGTSGIFVSTCAGRHDPGYCTWVLNSAVSINAPAGPAMAEPETPEIDAYIKTTRADDGSNKLELYMSSYDWTLYFGATPRTDGQVANAVWRIPMTYPNDECEIKLVADGLRVDVGETRRIDRKSSYDYRATLPYASLLSLAKSARVSGRLCGIEATLTDTQIEKLRELVVRIREEHAWDEEPVRDGDNAGPTEL